MSQKCLLAKDSWPFETLKILPEYTHSFLLVLSYKLSLLQQTGEHALCKTHHVGLWTGSVTIPICTVFGVLIFHATRDHSTAYYNDNGSVEQVPCLMDHWPVSHGASSCLDITRSFSGRLFWQWRICSSWGTLSSNTMLPSLVSTSGLRQWEQLNWHWQNGKYIWNWE